MCMTPVMQPGVMSGKLTQAKDDMELEARGKVRPPTDLLDPELAEVELARDYLKKMEEAVSFEPAEARTFARRTELV